MKKLSVLKILIGDIRFDGRVRKEIETLLANNIEVTLFNFTPSKNKNTILNHDKFGYIYKFKKQYSVGILNFLNIILFNLSVLKKIRKNEFDKIHIHDLNSTLFLMFYFPKKNNIEVVFDVHELFPETHEGFNNRIWNFIERKIVSKVDFFIFPEKNRLYYFQEKHSIPVEKLKLLENFPSYKDLNSSNTFGKKTNNSLSDGPTSLKCLYIGHLMEERGIEEIIKSFKHLPHDSLYVVGKGEKVYLNHLENVINLHNLQDRVFLSGPIENADIISYIEKFDVGFAFYENTNLNNYYCASNKIYEFLTLNKIIITNDYPGLIKLKNEDPRVICIPKIDNKVISNAILDYKNKGVIQTNKTYFWEDQSKKLLEIYTN